MPNETGIYLGRLDAYTLRELILNYKGNSDVIRRTLFDWYDEAKKLETEDDDLAKKGLEVSVPIIVIGRRL